MNISPSERRDRPIIFSGPMVRALLDGLKTQTRRLATSPLRNCQIGDRLYVRESGALLRNAYANSPATGEDQWETVGWSHAVDGDVVSLGQFDPPLSEWVDDCSRVGRPSIHMPRWASRLTLTVTDVRRQNLLDISEADAIAEGCVAGQLDDGFSGTLADGTLVESPGTWASARGQYQILWKSLHPDWDGWDDPKVVALTFTVERQNIDAANPSPNAIEVGKPMPYFCPACQSIPSAGYCSLPGCPTAPKAEPA